MQEYEQGRNALQRLSGWYAEHVGERNEATTRFHLIDELFVSCLAWPKEDITLEERFDGTYADYVFRRPTPVLIVEAKREGNYFELPAGVYREEYSLASLVRDYEDLARALKQASIYCQNRGVPVCVVGNGHQLVAFCGARVDGIPPLEGQAIVFPSLNIMLERFRLLWDLLSPFGIERRNLIRKLEGRVSQQVPSKLSASIGGYPGVVHRTAFQADMKILGDLLLEDVTERRELEPRFLEECYCKSGAVSQHAMVSKSLLRARYAALFDPDSPSPVLEPAVDKNGISTELLARSWSSRPALILGDVGVGKTMFLRYLRSVAAADLLEKAITFYIDLGSQAMLAEDLERFIVDQLRKQLLSQYRIDVGERNLVRGVYHGDLERFSKSIHSDLKSIDPDLYREKEIAFLEECQKDKPEHIRRCLEHIVHGRKQQVVVFVDNADQRDEVIQQKTFLICQELAKHWPATVFVTLRPETFHRSIRSGALSGYQPKEFFIAPPRIDRVIEKRLAFALRIANGEIPVSHIPDVGLKLGNLAIILEALLHSVTEDRSFLDILEHVSGGNVRAALGLLREFIGSEHVDSERIVNRVKAGSHPRIQPHELVLSIALGEAEYFDPSRSLLVNVFDIKHADGKEHFLLPIMIALAHKQCDPGVADGFVDCRMLAEMLQDLGFTPEQIELAFARLGTTRLLDVPTREPSLDGLPVQVRITDRGAFHAEWLCSKFCYVDAVVVDTPILELEARTEIRDIRRLAERLNRAEVFVHYLDRQWSPLEGKETEFDWRVVSGRLRSQIAEIREKL